MLCPVDQCPMPAVEYQGIEVDYCAECGGIWLDAGELELLMESPGGVLRLLTPANHAEKRHRCPICRETMVKTTCEEACGVILDQCPRGHGFWLDRGELEVLLDQAGQSSSLMGQFLRELFITRDPDTASAGES